MLVFSRKVGEGVVLPSCGVVVTVTRVAGKRVRLSVLAPPDVQVHRSEVLRRIKQGAAVDPAPPQPPIAPQQAAEVTGGNEHGCPEPIQTSQIS